MNPVYEKLQSCLKSVRAKTDFQPKIALILGSGLGDYADGIEIVDTIDYNEIEGFPISTVSGHKGRFVFGYVKGVPVVIMQGRVHYYEGYPMTDVVLGHDGSKGLVPHQRFGRLESKFPCWRLHGDGRPNCQFCTESADWHKHRRAWPSFPRYERNLQ
mgnify:CR=1 FL=1